MSQPVVGADIIVSGTPFRAVTDAEGGFVLANLPPGPYRVQLDGSLAVGGPLTQVERVIEVTEGTQTLEVVVMLPVEESTSRLVRIAGDEQVGVVGSPLLQPLVVAVEDAQGNPVSEVMVAFSISGGMGTLSSTLVSTDANGRAATILTVTDAGTVLVEATADGLGTVVFAANGVIERASVRLIVVSGDNQVTEPGSALPEPLVVRVEDQFGRPLAGELVVAEITQGQGEFLNQTDVGLPASAFIETDVQGEARFFLRAGADEENILTQVSARDQTVQFLTVVGFASPVDIAVEANGQLVLADNVLGAVVRVDSSTGVRTLVSGRGRGSGPPMTSPIAIAIGSDDSLIVADDASVAVLRVDPTTGARSLVSGVNADTGELRGSGPDLGPFIAGIAVEADGQLVVLNTGFVSPFFVSSLLRIDPATGNREIVSGCPALDLTTFACATPLVGSGPILLFPLRPAIEADGRLVVVDADLQAIVRIDPATGNREIVSGCPAIDVITLACTSPLIGSGPALFFPLGIAVETDGQLVTVDAALGAALRIDPVTGNRRTVSGVDFSTGEIRGDGPNFLFLTGIAIEADGSLMALDSNLEALVRVDPSNGDRTIISQAPRIGSGPIFALPIDIAVEEADGPLVVADAELKAVVRVDPITGVRIIVSGCLNRTCSSVVGSGPVFKRPRGLAVEANDRLVVVDSALDAVVRVELATGDRTTISGCTNDAPCTGTIGSGPLFRTPENIAVEADGQLVVVDADVEAVLRVNPATGDRTIISGNVTGSGPLLSLPLHIAVEANGQLIVTDARLNAVIRVDPVTGARTIVSDADTDSGPLLQNPGGLAIEANGQLVVTDINLRAVLRIDPDTGARALVSHTPSTGITIGSGPPFGFPRGLAVTADGQIVLADAALGAVLHVNSLSGDRTIISR
jgi:streptogramin lyase